MSEPTVRPAVSVVVPTRDRPWMLAECLSSIRCALGPADELVVVDSASGPLAAEVERVAREHGARTLRCERPGASRARNAGAAAARAAIVAFTDDDCLAAPDWIESLASAFGERSGLAFTTGRVLSDRPGRAVSVQLEEEGRDLRAQDDPAGLGHSANLACRREDFLAVGGFDERLGAGAPLRASEDKDLLWRLLRSGRAGAYLPAAVVTHRQWRRRREIVALGFAYGVGAGAFAVKVWRLEGGGRRLAERLVAHGAARVARLVVSGDRTGAITELARLVGALVGALRALRAPLGPDGRFAP